MKGTITRECGECTACCFALGVKELRKEGFHRCEHQCETGCGIYETRPETCRVYRCGWLEGVGERRDRPDRLGIIMEMRAPAQYVQERAEVGDPEAQAALERAKNTIWVREVRPGALGDKRVKRWLRAAHADGKLVLLGPFAGRKLPVGRPV